MRLPLSRLHEVSSLADTRIPSPTPLRKEGQQCRKQRSKSPPMRATQPLCELMEDWIASRGMYSTRQRHFKPRIPRLPCYRAAATVLASSSPGSFRWFTKKSRSLTIAAAPPSLLPPFVRASAARAAPRRPPCDSAFAKTGGGRAGHRPQARYHDSTHSLLTAKVTRARSASARRRDRFLLSPGSDGQPQRRSLISNPVIVNSLQT